LVPTATCAYRYKANFRLGAALQQFQEKGHTKGYWMSASSIYL